MTNRIGFISSQDKQTEASASKKNMFALKSGAHALVSGQTGSGKTQLVKEIIREKIQKEEGLLIIDEKNVLHRDVKQICRQLHPDGWTEKIYQIGSLGYGENDIRINILELATTSDKNARSFFDRIIVAPYADSDNHAFWAKSASNMAYNLFSYIQTIKKVVRLLKYSDEKFAGVYVLDKDKKNPKEIHLSFDAAPLTLNELGKYYKNHDFFRVLSELTDQIIMHLEEFVLRHIDYSKMNKREIEKLDLCFYNLRHEIGSNMSQYTLSSRSDASGDSGVLFTITSSIPDSMLDNPSINEAFPTHDIFETLEEKNILVVNSESLESAIVNTLLNTVWDTLSLRASRSHIPPVTCIVEEASRVFEKNADLEKTLSYARESLLSIVFVLQSTSQITDIFGAAKTDSILNNVTTFGLSSKEKPMPKFTFSLNEEGEEHTFTPVFFSKKELFKTELEFQTRTEQYNAVHRKDTEIVIFSQNQLDHKESVLVVDINTMRDRAVAYRLNKENKGGIFMEEYSQYVMEKQEEDEYEWDLSDLENICYNDEELDKDYDFINDEELFALLAENDSGY